MVQIYSWFSIYFNYFYLEIASRYIIFMPYKFLFDLAYMYVASFCRLLLAGTNLRTEPKHIVFLSQLLLLFQFCHVCKAENPELVAKQVGTEAVITTNCFNLKCPKKVNTWHSQPAMPNSDTSRKFPPMYGCPFGWRFRNKSVSNFQAYGPLLCFS